MSREERGTSLGCVQLIKNAQVTVSNMQEVTKQHLEWDWLFFVLLIKSLGVKPRFKNKTKTDRGTRKEHVNLFENEPHCCPCLRFTPDFTASRVIRELKLITTSGSEFVFVLNASLPYHMLAACAEALPRPNWELALYIIISGVMRYSVFFQGWLSLFSGMGIPADKADTPDFLVKLVYW